MNIPGNQLDVDGKQLPKHISECEGDCKVKMKKTKVLRKYGNRVGRELLEAFEMEAGGRSVVSEPSLKMLDEERELLAIVLK